MEIGNVDSVLTADIIGRSGSHTCGEAGDRMVEEVDSKIGLNLQTLDDISSAGLRIIVRTSGLPRRVSGASQSAVPPARQRRYCNLQVFTLQ